MDEYIKREDALDALMFELAGSGYQSRAIDVIRFLPTAEVASRAEVAREIFEEIENALESCYTPDSCADYPSPYYDLWLADRIAELKKEYTDVEPSKGGCHE